MNHIKAKTHVVNVGGADYLVMAQTKAGAVRDVVKMLAEQMREAARVTLATGEQLYLAGKNGTPILNHDHFKNVADPNQLPLSGIPESE